MSTPDTDQLNVTCTNTTAMLLSYAGRTKSIYIMMYVMFLPHLHMLGGSISLSHLFIVLCFISVINFTGTDETLKEVPNSYSY